MPQIARDMDEWPWRSSPMPDRAPPAVAVRDVLRHQADRRGRAPALISIGERLDYATVLDRVLAIAHVIDAKAAPGAPVATLLPHSPIGILAILGCLVAGRICIPLNISDPPERLALILAEATPTLLLATADTPSRVAVPRIDPAQASHAPAGWLPTVPAADAPAMVHFTSGSTGRPKGIVVSHHAVLHRARQCITDWGLAADDHVLAVTAPSIGSGFSFVLASLIAGTAKLVVSLAAEGAGALLRLAARERTTVLVAGPAILRLLLPLPAAQAAFASLRHVRIGAMALASGDLRDFRARLPARCAISHTYASTEAMVVAQWTVPPGTEGNCATVAAGYFTPALDFVLLAADDRAVPADTAGELVLRARHIALGEWQGGRLVPGRMQADLTRPGLRIFRTGDVVRLGANGILRVIGRTDRQFKVHGVRVEPGEIEAVLRASDAVVDAAVIADAAGRLHAIVAAPGANPVALRLDLIARLRANLPPTLRPAGMTILPALPLLPSGKHDLAALRRIAVAP